MEEQGWKNRVRHGVALVQWWGGGGGVLSKGMAVVSSPRVWGVCRMTAATVWAWMTGRTAQRPAENTMLQDSQVQYSTGSYMQ